MLTDTELKIKGLQILTKNLGDVEAERFIALIQREPFYIQNQFRYIPAFNMGPKSFECEVDYELEALY